MTNNDGANPYDTRDLRKFFEATLEVIDDDFIFPAMMEEGVATDQESEEFDKAYERHFELFMAVFLPNWKFTPPEK